MSEREAWRDITKWLPSREACLGWYEHLCRVGESEVRIVADKGLNGEPVFYVQARRRA